ncbi:type IV pili methyl-accepting chemotaxis transducer N-terminal domain-containing protein [Janthinobacterium aquaticum]|uniref:type IV pili methyl-accepting chemotaxis transducer N-terminal domain-containing protein n=1 Tax=Janthinobacterium sp. FT58W TaxID=2654254 RepID=UPI001264AAB7|nr:type IV pili methyl-accepting chemotaxis transducer N-terminal domain-containing protein [Janthinobacterium sp. FT58W]KAB8038503.1 HAMP domain-containing protein [Janthinobacterium sp. FT58W]
MRFHQMISSWQKLSTKIVGALLGMLILALSAIACTLYLSWQLEGSSAAINETGRLRMQTYQLTLLLAGDARGTAQQQVAVIDDSLERIGRGDPQRPLFLPPTPTIKQEFARIKDGWHSELRPAALASNTSTQAHAFELQAAAFVNQVNQLVRLIEQDSEQRTFWLRGSQLMLVGMAIVGTVTMIYLMFMLIIEPVTRLRMGMQRMKERDFSVRLAVESNDEFGQLASGFNQMADRLQALYGNLEEGVRSKTATLEYRNRELALLYESSAFLQRPQPLEALCGGFMERIVAYFDADGSTVRVLDLDRGNLHMVVHHGLSEELVASEHCLKVGDCLCGTAVEQKVAKVHDMRRIDKAHELRCHREGFATVSVFQIHAHEQQLGFFNLHFRHARAFSARELALLETLGQLLGVALENLRLAAREREMAISEERNLVAQGLHDSIAQSLNFLNLQVQMLDDSVRKERYGEVEAIVPALQAGIKESYDDVRELLLNFRSRLMEDDLIGSLRAALDKFRRQTGIAAELLADVDGAPFPREQQLQLLFIVQEALSNIRKHAQATHVEVRLADDQDFALTVSDNGVGFDMAEVLERAESHVGIHIMRERAQRIAATFEVHAQPGGGTTVELHLAREQRRAA